VKEQNTMLKGKSTSSGSSRENEIPRENTEINAKIDAYIENNPKVFERLNEYSKERLVRMHILSSIDREESINNSIKKDWEQHPEKKAALETLVASYPKEKQEEAMIQLARQAKVQESRAKQSKGNEQNIKQDQSSRGVSV
jgi:hypothetical protein